jgi:Kef-type K+ transport system membrane component KefB
MAPASAPAGTVAVIQEYRSKGPLTSLLLGVVGLDDAFAILIYAFAAAGAKILLANTGLTLEATVLGPALEIVGGLAVGSAVGGLLALLLWRSDEHSDMLIYSIAAVLLATGLASALGLSLILANLAVGAVLANASPRSTERAYDAVGQITGPIYILFFVVAGAHLDLRLLAGLSLLGPVYILGRSAGLIGGAWIGATVSRADRVTRRYLGLGILSQAGVAIGLALAVANEFASPEYGTLGRELAKLTINTIAATTIVFEVVGPIATKIALSRAGEIPEDKKTRGATP